MIVDWPGQPLPLPPLEPDLNSTTEDSGQGTHSNHHNTILATGVLVPDDQADDDHSTNTSSMVSSPPSTRQQHNTSGEEPPLVHDCMACKWEELMQEGASELLLSIFFDSPSVIHCQHNYSGAAGQYIHWCKLEQLNPFTPNTLTILNFLSYGSLTLRWQASTVSTYKSAILSLFMDPSTITNDPWFKNFMTIIRAGSTKRLTNLSLDLDPILQHFQKLSDNNSMHIRDLT